MTVPILDLRFQFTSFWIQIHDLLIHCLTLAVRNLLEDCWGNSSTWLILQRKVVRATTSESGCELMSQNLLAEYGRFGQREGSLDGRRLGMNVSLTSVIGVVMCPMMARIASGGYRVKVL